jgi:hypothetical protein
VHDAVQPHMILSNAVSLSQTLCCAVHARFRLTGKFLRKDTGAKRAQQATGLPKLSGTTAKPSPVIVVKVVVTVRTQKDGKDFFFWVF